MKKAQKRATRRPKAPKTKGAAFETRQAVRRKSAEVRTPPAAETSAADCLVVGVGASAGGLEAFTELLSHLPTDTGLALALVQHLDPKYPSVLTELISRSTEMAVEQVADRTPVKPGHVYVIPPNKDMVIAKGLLRLEPRPQGGQHMPVDHFLRSLAEDKGEKAIAVILSGTASDGTLGVKAIKAAGGITFAQAPQSARYDGMPRNAIATSCVDAVLTPEGIARELIRLRDHSYLRAAPAPEEGPIQADSLREIFNLLRAATGVDFNLYKPATIRRRTMRRMALLKMDSVEQYARYMRGHREELAVLFQDLLINVTAFFREAETFQALKASVLPAIFNQKQPGEPVRVWVPGCATGEEAYSLAICVLEYLRKAKTEIQLQVFGTDLSDSALEKARAGIYPETIAADVSPERLRRFFVRENNAYQIIRSVRDTCIFARQNVTKDPPFSRLDLILCRNVLIYLGPALQMTALRMFHYGLLSHGYLVLGLSESAGSAGELFAPTDKKLKIYAKRPAPLAVALDLELYRERSHAPHAEGAPAAGGLTIRSKVDQMILTRYSPPAVVVDRNLRILEFRGRTAPYVEHPAGAANLDLLKMLPPSLGLQIQTLVRKALGENATVKGGPFPVSFREKIQHVTVWVSPIQADGGAGQFLVILEEPPKPGAANTAAPVRGRATPKDSESNRRIKHLEDDLLSTRQHLQSVREDHEAATEELKSAHEEVQSANEELQSTNEELLTAKEELQSTNEELTTVNEEMRGRNAELQQLNNDLLNMFSSVSIPMLMLSSDLRIRRFTPQAEKPFNLLASDLGRPISDLRFKFNIPDIVAVCREVLEDLRPKEREVHDGERAYLMSIRPYRTVENRIEGVVLFLFELTERKQSAEARYRRLFKASTDGIVIADAATGEIVDVNPFVVKLFGYPRARLIGAAFWESPLFDGTGMNQAVLEQLRGSDYIQSTVAIPTESGQHVNAEVVANLYNEGEKQVIQFNIRHLTERQGAESKRSPRV